MKNLTLSADITNIVPNITEITDFLFYFMLCSTQNNDTTNQDGPSLQLFFECPLQVWDLLGGVWRLFLVTGCRWFVEEDPA